MKHKLIMKPTAAPFEGRLPFFTLYWAAFRESPFLLIPLHVMKAGSVIPLPVGHFRQILPVLVDVLLVLHQLIAHLLIQIRAAIAQLRQVLDRLLYQVEAVYIVLHAYIEGRPRTCIRRLL